MIRIAIAGVAGRMGRTLVQAVQARNGDAQVTAGTTLAEDPQCGQDIGLIAGVGALNVKAVDSLSDCVDEFLLLHGIEGFCPV